MDLQPLAWIPMYRLIREVDWVYRKSSRYHLWSEILFRAYHEELKYPVMGRTIVLQVGQFVGSTRVLAASVGGNPGTVNRNLVVFESQGWLERKDIGNLTLYTVLQKQFLKMLLDSAGRPKSADEAVAEGQRLEQSSAQLPAQVSARRIEKEKKKIIKTSSSLSREEEFEIFENLCKNSEWLEAEAQNLGITSLEFKEKLELFWNKQLEDRFAEGNFHKDFGDLRDHIRSWMRLVLKSERKKHGRNNTNLAARATDVRPDSKSDDAQAPRCGLIED